MMPWSTRMISFELFLCSIESIMYLATYPMFLPKLVRLFMIAVLSSKSWNVVERFEDRCELFDDQGSRV